MNKQTKECMLTVIICECNVLMCQQDYMVLEQPIFDFYMNVYGGGPAILRYSDIWP